MKVMDVTNKEIAEAFRYAKVRIEDGTNLFICNAVPKTAAGAAAREVIGDRIGGCGRTIVEWLEEQGVVVLSYVKLREYRLRWLDNLIEEFEA